MGWLESIKGLATAEPIECPRGWGDVTFIPDGEGFPIVSRKCPIGGVPDCVSCRYSHNPTRLDQLRGTLADLEMLCEEGKLTEKEYQQQRRMVLSFQHATENLPGEGLLITSWILVPLGISFAVAGGWLGTQIHAALFALAGVGALLIALGISFGGIGLMKRSRFQRRLDEQEDSLYESFDFS